MAYTIEQMLKIMPLELVLFMREDMNRKVLKFGDMPEIHEKCFSFSHTVTNESFAISPPEFIEAVDEYLKTVDPNDIKVAALKVPLMIKRDEKKRKKKLG